MLFAIYGLAVDGSHYTRKTIKAVRFSRLMKKAQKSYAQFHLRA